MTADGKDLLEHNDSLAYLNVYWHADGSRNYLTDAPFVSVNIKAHYSGHSTLEFPKKQIEIKFYDDTWQNKTHIQFPTLNNQTHYRLVASYSDKTLMRDKLAYDIAREVYGEVGLWGAPDSRFCEVFFVNDVTGGIFPSASTLAAAYYYGAFLLAEKIERGKSQIDIKKLKGTSPIKDIDGGYIFSIDYPKTGQLVCIGDESYNVIYPAHPNVDQQNYACNYIHTFERSFGWGNFSQYVNFDAAARYFILQELARNVDEYRLSFFFYKNRTSDQLILGPIWDMDIAWGNANYAWANLTTGLQLDTPIVHNWWMVWLRNDANFQNVVGRLWQQLRASILSQTSIDHYILTFTADLSESQARNFALWKILGVYVWPEPEPIPPTWAGEIAKLQQWIHARLANLDSIFLPWIH